MPKCFIIMPITTRPELLPIYENDVDHFKHVLEHLFIPAVKNAGFEPIPPATEGSDVIHAKIISNLSAADMVLCDMSALNPNVFFEMGIRTALNKPTCLIKDDVTTHVPFDASIINYHTYAAKLMAWNINSETGKLLKHIKKTVSSEQPGNAMWHFFGLSDVAHLRVAEPGKDSWVEYLTLKMDQLSSQIDQIQKPSDYPKEREDRELKLIRDAVFTEQIKWRGGGDFSTGIREMVNFLLNTGYSVSALAVMLRIPSAQIDKLAKGEGPFEAESLERIVRLYNEKKSLRSG
jgi:hypothetical protein